MDITNVVMPNLIAHEIVKIHPMASRSGYIMYRKFVTGSKKDLEFTDGTLGGDRGTLLNGTFALGKPQSQYTSRKVTMGGAAVAAGETITLKWTPVVHGTAVFTWTTTASSVDTIHTAEDKGDGKFYEYGADDVVTEYVNNRGYFVREHSTAGTEVSGLTITYGSVRDGSGVGPAGSVTGTVTYTNTFGAAMKTGSNWKLGFEYDNEYIPQNDLPLVSVTNEVCTLFAKSRKIAINYSRTAAFEQSTDYSVDLGKQLYDQAVAQLAYEIDTECVENVMKCGDKHAACGTWYAGQPIGVSLRDHYASIIDLVGKADVDLYGKTQKFTSTFILCGINTLRFFNLCNEFKAASTKTIMGPYVAGELLGKTVVVSPAVTADKIYFGVNTPDAFAVVYATYMPIVPTQLLEFADGSNSQGFSTMYDVKIVNDILVVKGLIENSVGTLGGVTTNPIQTHEIS